MKRDLAETLVAFCDRVSKEADELADGIDPRRGFNRRDAELLDAISRAARQASGYFGVDLVDEEA